MKSRVADPTTLFGILIALGLVAAAIIIGGSGKDGLDVNVLGSFVDIPSVLIVVLGTLLLTMASFSASEMFGAQKLIARTIFYRSENPSQSAKRGLDLTELVRKEGLLALDKHKNAWKHNPFLEKGLQLLIDGVMGEQVVKLIKEDVMAMMDRHANGVLILRKAAELSPAMGLIGTLIGLVQMLGNLEDPSTIGPAMAVALLTTFYGALMSYMLFSPLATKLERNSREEVNVAKIYLRSIEAITTKENPRQLEVALNGLLPPNRRIHYFDILEG
jgi:chemotaxis protein MotA